MTVLGMDAIRWTHSVQRYTTKPTRGPRCRVCKAPYAAFIEFALRVSTTRYGGDFTMSVNLPCWHVDPVCSDVDGKALQFAPDVQARLLLIAEDVRDA